MGGLCCVSGLERELFHTDGVPRYGPSYFSVKPNGSGISDVWIVNMG